MPDTISPDLTVLDTEGESVRLADLAAEGPILIAFLRHFG